MSYTDKLKKTTATGTAGRSDSKLFLITGGRDEKMLRVWHYVRIPSIKQASFNRAVMSGHIDFKAFGEVVLSGYGATPPEDVLKRMAKEQA